MLSCLFGTHKKWIVKARGNTKPIFGSANRVAKCGELKLPDDNDLRE
jgi:hypothetical protein